MARPLRTELEKFIVKTDPVIPPQTYTVGSTYDAAGRRTGITYPDGTTVTRTYTERDQLAQIDYNGDMVATYTHDSSGRRTTRTLGDTPNTQTQWQYTRADNLTTAIQSDIPGASFTYTYDANKNKLTESISAPMTPYGFSTTSYDDSDRLTSWNRADGNKNQTWALSQVGDWNAFTETGSTPSTETRTHTSVHELTQINTTPLTYDAKGNLTQNSNGHTYTWDFDSRLTSATVVPNTHTYTYDALGRRVSKTVVDGSSAATTIFVCLTQPIQYSPHAGQVVAEYLSNTTPSAAERKYVYASYIDEPVVMIDRTVLGSVGVGIDEKFFYHRNSLYSISALTDQSGAVQEHYSYTPYGDLMIFGAPMQTLTTSTIKNDYTYTGRRHDFETELYYYRARYYNALQGRFVSRDPVVYTADLNLYSYVDLQPTGMVDPSGKWFSCLGISGGVTVFVALGPGSLGPLGGGLSLSAGCYYCVGRSTTMGWYCGPCCSGVITVMPLGIGVAAGVGAGPSIMLNFIRDVNKPSEGYGLLVGAGAGVNVPGLQFPVTGEVTIDYDVMSGDTTITIPKLSYGMALYYAVRVSGSCTGCKPGITKKLTTCVNTSAAAITTAVRRLTGMRLKANSGPTVMVIKGAPATSGDIPENSIPGTAY